MSDIMMKHLLVSKKFYSQSLRIRRSVRIEDEISMDLRRKFQFKCLEVEELVLELVYSCCNFHIQGGQLFSAGCCGFGVAD